MYYIYRVKSPSGRAYVGLSKDPRSRWRSHVRRSRDPARQQHPFYRAILKYGAEAFTHDVLAEVSTLAEARAVEIACIALEEDPYNVSPGGEYDALIGPKIFWDRMRSDPEEYAAYRAKLSAALKRAGAEGRIDSTGLVAYNKGLGARVRWILQHRATRVAARVNKGKKRTGGGASGNPTAGKEVWAAKPPSAKKRHSMVSRANAKALWARRTPEQRAQVGGAIAETQRKRCAPGTAERARWNAAARKGRETMDRRVQGAAASKGLKTFWAELKTDPVRYAEHIARRRETLMETLERKKNARKDV